MLFINTTVTINPLRSGGSRGFLYFTLQIFALTQLILELQYCACVRVTK